MDANDAKRIRDKIKKIHNSLENLLDKESSSMVKYEKVCVQKSLDVLKDFLTEKHLEQK
jgi:Holliday junction resolvasome RuvABC endonuclease subunit